MCVAVALCGICLAVGQVKGVTRGHRGESPFLNTDLSSKVGESAPHPSGPCPAYTAWIYSIGYIRGRRAASTSVSVQTQVDFGIVFSTELQLGRTRCGKFDEDIDNCPFQAKPDVNNVRHATAALRLHGRGRCLGAGGVGSDDNAIPRDTEGAFAGRSPARQASPGSLACPWPV